MASCQYSPPTFRDKWLKIVPDQSNTEDVLDLLGSPYLKHTGTFGEMWCYQPTGEEQGCVEFRSDYVLTKSSSLGLDPQITAPYTVADLLQDYGIPSTIYEYVVPSDPFGVPVIDHWIFVYPEKGFDVILGKLAYVKPNTAPISENFISSRIFYTPMSIDGYRATLLPAMYGVNPHDEVINIDQYLSSVSSP
jgi:hypothetical protein